jgi:hypothetical protein
MSYCSTILSQVIKEVNKYDFENQVSKNNGDKKTKKIECKDILTTMIFSQLARHDFTRDIINGLKTFQNDYYHLGIDHEIKRSSFSYALNKRPYKVFENFFYSMLKELTPEQKRKFNRKVNLIDSTTISLCLEKFDWAKYKRAKGGIKLHTMIDYDTLIPEKIIISNAKVHDIKGIEKNIDFKAGEIYVMDRGYACYRYLNNIDSYNAYFVTRIKDNWKIIRTSCRNVNRVSGVLLDENIEVAGNKNNEYPKELRMITFYHAESQKVLRFITNNFEMASDEIAELYKSRWQIELFFKWIKQHLKIKSFYSTSKNGVLIQIWSVLITYLLMIKIKTKYKIKMNVYEILRIIRNFINKRIDIYNLLTGIFDAKAPPNYDKKYGQLEIKFA